MTFTELRTEILDRLNLSSTDASTRIGRAINRTYRKVTTTLGLDLSRRRTVSMAVTQGVSEVIFSNVEKIINVYDRSISPYRKLDEVTIDEIEMSMPFTAADNPTAFAVKSYAGTSITIVINRIPQTAFTLYADVDQKVSDLSGADVPAFPESYHDVIIEGVLMDELRKMEKPQLAAIAKKQYEDLLSDLRMWIAKSAVDIYQGKTQEKTTRGGGGSGSTVNGALSWTQTGLITFNRGVGVAPFAVSDTTVVTNLNADLLDGHDSLYFAVSGSPGVHATQHQAGGSDPIQLDNLAAPDDNTDLNVSTTKHGLTPKLPNDATKFFDGTGAYDTVADADLATTDVTTNDVSTSKHGFASKRMVVGTIALTDGATPALDASLGNVFRLDAAGNRTIAVPTNPVSGQKITIIHFASGGARTLALNTGAGGFRFGTDITALTSTTSGKTDYIGCIYNATDSKWDVVAYTKGF